MLITWPEPAVRIYTMLYNEHFMLTMLVLMCLISVSNADLKYQLPVLSWFLGSLVSPGWVLELEIELTNFNMDPIFSC